MHVIYPPNPDFALAEGIEHLKRKGVDENSRVGRVLSSPYPVATVWQTPLNRVSRSPVRDANPFFHLAEALWMLAGREDLATLTLFVPRFEEFSDNGATLNGAYGYRWRRYFGYDQLETIARELVANPSTRRAVLSMWDGAAYGGDLNAAIAGSKDVPCNTHAYFRVLHGALHMTVLCRSNDMVWGAYGANIVHFSFLLEFMAATIGAKVGSLTQVSNNFHAYIDREDTRRLFEARREDIDVRGVYQGAQTPLISPGGPGGALFLDEAETFLRAPFSYEGSVHFLKAVAKPMFIAHGLHKSGDTAAALDYLLRAAPDPWCAAGYAWLQRRAAKKTAMQEVRPS